MLNDIISAVHAKDFSRILDLIEYVEVDCLAAGAAPDGFAPECVDGPSAGTRVEAFTGGDCDSGWVTRAEAGGLVAALLIVEPLELYAAHGSDEPGLWIYFQSPRDGRVVTIIAGDGIVSVARSCARVTGDMTLGPVGDFIIPPQYER
jgi:hypothetical protein